MNLAALVFNSFQENTYVLWDDTNESVIVDAGNGNPREDAVLEKFIRERNLKPVFAINTHGHIDHILGVGCVKETHAVPFAMHGSDAFLLDTAAGHARLYGMEIAAVPEIDIDLSRETEIRFGNTLLEVIHTPGHSPGCVCLFDRENKIMLTGDTLFKESIGRTDLPGGDYRQIMNSLFRKIIPLGGDVRVYPGHGPSTSIGREVQNNPFIVEVVDGEINV
ncbi:MAG: MBL fold metallo-hydrolase [Rikenellaceae bacterium]|nr:MBL fold metallo-hydrolase [Rikenellaceae bacterium]